MKRNTAELTGAALDWAVAKCEGKRLSGASLAYQVREHGTVTDGFCPYSPSTDWSQGGPIIERERITLQAGGWHDNVWRACHEGAHPYAGRQYGPTALIAALRCYVASRFGDSVEVPDGL